MQAAAIASHRFGLSETSLAGLQGDPRGWVLAQLQRPEPLDARGLMDSTQALQLGRRVLRAAQDDKSQAVFGAAAALAAASGPPAEADPGRRELRLGSARALQRRWQQAVSTPTPVFERWVHFWSNHFCVSATKGSLLGLVLPHEREAIRPHVLGPFATLLRAATLHPAMLLYLDNARSIGPHSLAGRRREKGLNENLARELLELHTLGVNGGYTQDDVVELARLLTGWTVLHDGVSAGTRFMPALHEPDAKRVLGRTYAAGPKAADALFADLARHPSTARFIATKLVRHFVSDEPPAPLVDAVAARFLSSDGDLLAVAQTLFGHDLAWQPDTPRKLKRPEELVLSAHRMLKLPVVRVEPLVLTLVAMGQAVGRAPSPAGWPDRSADWLGPDALWKRIEWAQQFAADNASLADARRLAELSLGRDLGDDTRVQIDRAESGPQAMALWLASPDFQRR